MITMKIRYIKSYTLLLLLSAVLYVSCTKGDSDGSWVAPAGNPVSAGFSPDSAANGELVTLKGTGLGDIRSIVFDKENVAASFYSTLNTETTIIFRVPDTAYGGEQKVIVTNSTGKQLILPFRVLAYPTVSSSSLYEFKEDTEITLTGTNLLDVEKVVLTGTTDEAEIIDQTSKSLTIKMPASNVVRTTLDITNATGKLVTSQEFIYIPNNFVAFDDDWGQAAAYGGTVQSWSWGCNPYPFADLKKDGEKSLRVDYTGDDGGLSLFLGADWGDPVLQGFSDYFKARHITFWARGDAADVNITIVPDGPWPTGSAQGSGSHTFTVLKDVWTYYKIPMSFITGGYSRLNFKIEGASDKTVYFDNILLVK